MKRRVMLLNRSLPEEIISEVLLKLPAKDVIQCKRVCRLWRSLISNANFVKSHLALAQAQPGGIIFPTCSNSSFQIDKIYQIDNLDVNDVQKYGEENLRVENIQLPTQAKTITSIESSCHGLLLVQTPQIGDYSQLYVYNPVTKQLKALPTIYLGHEYQWGLVHDDCIGKYKVFGLDFNKQVVLTLGMDTNWRKAHLLKTTAAYFEVSPLLAFAKELHCLALECDTFTGYSEYAIYSVNIANEQEFTRTIVPSNIPEHCNILAEVRGSLCLVNGIGINDEDVVLEHLQVWVLEDRVKSKWTQKYDINILSPSFLASYGSDWVNSCSFALRNRSDSFSSLLKILIHHGDDLYLYDLNNGNSRILPTLTMKEYLCGPQYMFCGIYRSHVNSLVNCEGEEISS